MSHGEPTTYDEVPYADLAHDDTHPDRLATVARLHGMHPAPIGSCRVLELGCAQGGNLIPMAIDLPGARFVGIDLSARQIAEGRRSLEELQVTNVELRAASILEVDESWGTFDYIVCHGVYSWVPDPVREKILTICAENLAAEGVAYISYNVYPGWHARGMMRAMMNYHACQFDRPTTQVQQARAILDFLVKSVRYPESPFARQLADEVAGLEEDADWYLYHEYLESENRPFYFHEFAGSVAATGLQYLGSAYFRSWDANLPPQTDAYLRQLAPDRIRREQYLDFLCNTPFRRSLLCHRQVTVHEPTVDALEGLLVRATARPVSIDPDLGPDVDEEFQAVSGDRLTTDSPLVKTTLAVLHEARPRALGLDELRARVRSRLLELGIPCDVDRDPLREVVLQAALSNLVALHVHEPQLAVRAGGRPLANPWARHQARSGTEVTNQRHARVNLSEPERLVLRLLDGRHDRDALCSALAADGVTDPSALLDQCLDRLASEALLIA